MPITTTFPGCALCCTSDFCKFSTFVNSFLFQPIHTQITTQFVDLPAPSPPNTPGTKFRYSLFNFITGTLDVVNNLPFFNPFGCSTGGTPIRSWVNATTIPNQSPDGVQPPTTVAVSVLLQCYNFALPANQPACASWLLRVAAPLGTLFYLASSADFNVMTGGVFTFYFPSPTVLVPNYVFNQIRLTPVN